MEPAQLKIMSRFENKNRLKIGENLDVASHVDFPRLEDRSAIDFISITVNARTLQRAQELLQRLVCVHVGTLCLNWEGGLLVDDYTCSITRELSCDVFEFHCMWTLLKDICRLIPRSARRLKLQQSELLTLEGEELTPMFLDSLYVVSLAISKSSIATKLFNLAAAGLSRLTSSESGTLHYLADHAQLPATLRTLSLNVHARMKKEYPTRLETLLRRYTNLESLKIGTSDITNVQLHKVLYLVAQLPKVRVFHFNKLYNLSGAQRMATARQAFRVSPTIRELSFNTASWQSSIVWDWLSILPSLEVLKLGGEGIWYEIAGVLNERCFPVLRELKISNLYPTCRRMPIFDVLFSLQTLTKLTLGNIVPVETDAPLITAPIEILRTSSRKYFSAAAVSSLINSIARPDRVRVLRLGVNSIGTHLEAESIGRALSRFTNLDIFELRQPFSRFVGREMLIEGLKSARYLSVLKLPLPDINTPATLPALLEAFPYLRKFSGSGSNENLHDAEEMIRRHECLSVLREQKGTITSSRRIMAVLVQNAYNGRVKNTPLLELLCVALGDFSRASAVARKY